MGRDQRELLLEGFRVQVSRVAANRTAEHGDLPESRVRRAGAWLHHAAAAAGTCYVCADISTVSS